MIGVDQSEEMLAPGRRKVRQASEIPPLFLHQSMDKLDLYGTIDACVCCLDSVNYVTSPQKLERAFQRVHTFLMPGGLFMFDVNTPDKLRALDGQVFLDESADAYCVWRADYSARRRVCTYGMDLFTLEPDGRWSRAEELHEEYAYEPDELEALLVRGGLFPHQTIRRAGSCAPPKRGRDASFLPRERNPDEHGRQYHPRSGKGRAPSRPRPSPQETWWSVPGRSTGPCPWPPPRWAAPSWPVP